MCIYAHTIVYESSKRNLDNLKRSQINIIVFFLRKKSFLGIISCCVISCLPIIDQEMDACLNFISGLVDGIYKKVNKRCMFSFS